MVSALRHHRNDDGQQKGMFEIFQACAHLGVTYVPVNWHWVPDELAYVLEDADVKVLW